MTPPKTAIVIPARYASSRYPGKPLATLTGATGETKPLIRRSWEAARQVPGVAHIVVATDDVRIADAVHAFGGAVAMTPESCANGTERCAAALPALGDVEIVVNFQGDALLTPPHFVGALIEAMLADESIAVATPAIVAGPVTHRRLVEDQAQGRVGGTTVVCDARGNGLYFSKSVIPHVPADRIGEAGLPVRLHVGVYAYRRFALERYAQHPASALEGLEGLEQLRFLDAGVPVRVIDVDPHGADIWELNNPSDVAPIERALAARGIA
ncbi:3-deoxy-manno-octulosonate cytidylyltransferase [Sphingomonas nostoxanthinifaciens]|uniref:3-deoxy-manno-octulosonate cytidylyltransferase n=1 Tax=Sphingomonas nostoxanthinifaciens TaxID=2872652 RepID=UPI001CC1E01D|nr:manno-octulosonate cytidylyltransferase [Sphingomonas nostoxanthinifaciens]UAK24978.1 3-deoxy-manno-octulosonate cytidylyltransferase [Sphingomonas nostoxanthinifaciens]